MDTVVLATAARRLLLLHDDAIHRGHVAAAGAPSPRPGAADPPQSASFPKLLPVFILFVLLLCFLSIFVLRDLLHFFSLWLRRRRRLLDAERAAAASDHDAALDAPQKPAGLDPAVLATFPTARFQEDPAAACSASSAPECAVCLSEFAAGDAVRLLTACRHAFHVPCIDAWLAAHTTCPVCRCELAAPPPPRAPGYAAAVLRHHEHDDNGAGAASARRDSGGARSQFDR